MKGQSKFDYDIFCGGYDFFAVSKQRYSREEAIEIAKRELQYAQDEEWELAIGDGFVCHRAGVNEDGEPQVGWWLEYSDRGRSCPVWMFHRGRLRFDKGYEYIKVLRGEHI